MNSIRNRTRFEGAIALAVSLAAPAAHADDKTVTKSQSTSDGGYVETRKGNGSEYKYKTDGIREQEAYQGHGVQKKTSSDGITTKSVYQDGDCQQKSVDNAASGKAKVVSKGDCAQ